MKKSMVLIGLFVFLTTVALVYAIQYLGGGNIPLSVQHNPPQQVIPITSNPVTTVITGNPASNILFEWKLGNPYLLKNGSGDVFLDLRVTGKNLPNIERKRMNVVLVIDRSGSMGSENKLEQVKEAAAGIINNMNATDRLAVVIYDDSIQTLIPSSPVENKERLKELIYSLTPGGSTNLCGGLQQGFQEARAHFNKNYVNRIILLSDGLANVGITDPEQIDVEAKRIREYSISVSTMGVGIEYNENLMASIADYSGGNYYYISKEVNMAEIFRREWNLMQSLIARDALASLQLGAGVDVVSVEGFKWEKNGRKLTIRVPDIYSGETKRILVQLRAPSEATKVVNLGQGQFICTEVLGKGLKPVSLTFNPTIRVVEDHALVAKNVVREVQAKVAQSSATEKMNEAYKLFEAGDKDAAYTVANDAVESLQSLGYADAENAKQVGRYRGILQHLKPSAPEMSRDDKADFLKKQKEEERKQAQSSPQ